MNLCSVWAGTGPTNRYDQVPWNKSPFSPCQRDYLIDKWQRRISESWRQSVPNYSWQIFRWQSVTYQRNNLINKSCGEELGSCCKEKEKKNVSRVARDLSVNVKRATVSCLSVVDKKIFKKIVQAQWKIFLPSASSSANLIYRELILGCSWRHNFNPFGL